MKNISTVFVFIHKYFIRSNRTTKDPVQHFKLLKIPPYSSVIGIVFLLNANYTATTRIVLFLS